MNKLQDLSIDIFIKLVTYLPFKDVVSLCLVNSKFHNFSTNNRYNIHWKALIDNTFSFLDDYHEKLDQIQSDLGYNNYIIYTQFIKYLDPITQLMIYYRQGDMDSFDDCKFHDKKRFLTMFLLGEKEQIRKYVPRNTNIDYYEIRENFIINILDVKDTLDRMLSEINRYGNLRLIKYLVEQGADIHFKIDEALRHASMYGHLDIVKYLVEQGAHIHAESDEALKEASDRGHLNVVKYLVENGANIHARNDGALIRASQNGHLDIVKYLVEQGADIRAVNGEALRWSSQNGHLNVVKYLVENGAYVHADALKEASGRGHLNVVKYLIEQGADVHAENDKALRWASRQGHLDVVNYLKSLD